MSAIVIDEFTLNAPDGGGRYFPTSNSMAFAQRIPDEFPYVDLSTMQESDIGPTASVIEEFAHRFQFHATHFGYLYRLSSLLQSSLVLEILAWLGKNPASQLPLPWVDADSDDPWVRERLSDLHALEDFKRVLFGLSLRNVDAVNSFHSTLQRVKDLIQTRTPIDLQHFSTFGGINELYTASGQVKLQISTRAIVESHASAFAFEVIRRNAPAKLNDAIESYIKKNRRGLYSTIEKIADSIGLPMTMDLDAVLRLGDYALDGKIVDVPTIPPPSDYIESAFPYQRYEHVMGRLESINDTAKKAGHRDLGIHKLVEIAIHLYGDDRGMGMQLGVDAAMALEGRSIQLATESDKQYSWLENAENDNPLSPAETLVRREIVTASQQFMQANLSFAPDARRFDPTMAGLATICRLADLPSIEYPEYAEIFLCEQQETPDQAYLAWRISIHGIVTVTNMLMRCELNDLVKESDRLATLHAPGLMQLEQGLNFSASQLE